MSLIDDFKQAVTWTSPEGDTFILKTLESGYSQKHLGEIKENPSTKSKSSDKKTTADVNDTFTDLGIGGRDVTLDCYFIGENHYTQAQNFEKALCQLGKSKLQLAYGDEFTVNVISFKLSNTLVQNANCTVINVNWHETAKTTYPQSDKSKTKEIKNTAEITKSNLAETFADAVNSAAESTTRLQTFEANFTNALNKVSSALDFANNTTLRTIMNDILGQNLTTSALTMATQLGIVFSKAAMLVNKVKNIDSVFDLSSQCSTLFSGWDALVSSLTSGTTTSTDTVSLSTTEIDNLIINDTVATMGIVSLAETVTESDYDTRAEAVEAVKNLVEITETWTDCVEDEYKKITELKNAYIRDNELENVVMAAANEILERSYKLKIEKTIVLSEDKTTIDVAYEYYTDDFKSDPDGTVDYLITTNGFTDDQFFILPRGTKIKIYI